MKNANDYLDLLKSSLPRKSEYALSKALDISDATLRQVRRETRPLSVAAAGRLAELLEVDPVLVVSATRAASAKRTDERKVWESIYKSATAALVALFISFAAPPQDAQAGTMQTSSEYRLCALQILNKWVDFIAVSLTLIGWALS